MSEKKQSPNRPATAVAAALLIISVILAVLGLSQLARTALAEQQEEMPQLPELTLSAEMTLGQIAQANELPPMLIGRPALVRQGLVTVLASDEATAGTIGANGGSAERR